MKDTENRDLLLIQQLFNEWNTFKRFNTLSDIELEKGNKERSQHFIIQSYKYQSRIELSLRSMQAQIRNNSTK